MSDEGEGSKAISVCRLPINIAVSPAGAVTERPM
jgi:hypothetical protein